MRYPRPNRARFSLKEVVVLVGTAILAKAKVAVVVRIALLLILVASQIFVRFLKPRNVWAEVFSFYARIHSIGISSPSGIGEEDAVLIYGRGDFSQSMQQYG